jgi:hypothetical protein
MINYSMGLNSFKPDFYYQPVEQEKDSTNQDEKNIDEVEEIKNDIQEKPKTFVFENLLIPIVIGIVVILIAKYWKI